MRKLIIKIALCISICFSTVYADDPTQPLRVAVPRFLPPYSMEGANKELSGFDIIFISHICKLINRTCVYIPMETNEILPAVASHQVDVGIGTIKITLAEYKLVNFSIPYAMSYSRFIGPNSIKNFNLYDFNNKKLGMTSGGLFGTEVNEMKGFTPKAVRFNRSSEVVEALNNGSIDLAIMDNPTALYWQNQSGGALKALGQPISFGFGLGIAVNQDDTELMQLINQAIVTYQATPQFKQIYKMYFGEL